MKIKKQLSLPSKYWLLIVTGICIVFIGLSLISEKATGPFKWIADYTVIPMQKGINKAGMFLSDLTDNFETLEEMKKENKNLKEQVDSLTMSNNQLQQDKYELERLRELYKLDQNYTDYKKVGARVIGNNGSNWFSTFTIDKGSEDGIKKDMNVMAGKGLVGIVTKVSPHSSEVRSIIDDQSNVSGMILSTSDTCIVRGDLKLMADGKLRFEQLENNKNEVKEGEQVITSHISSKYVQGILIGYVSEVSVDENNLTRSGYITPVVDFKKLQEVLVITPTKEDMVEKK